MSAWIAEALESRVLLASAPAQLTAAELLKDLNTAPESSSPSDFFTHNGVTYFAASDGDHGNELWKTDGTAAGTVLVKDINPGAMRPQNDSHPHSFLAIGDTIYFLAGPSDSVFPHLWRIDGTTAGTREVYDTQSFSGNFPLAAYNGAVVFLVDNQLFRADSNDHVQLLGGDTQGSGFGTGNASLAQSGGLLYATIDTNSSGDELWVSDGTPAGTRLVKDIAPGFTSSLPRALVNLNGKLLFGASDSGDITAANGQLWKTDGTPAGTIVLKRGVFPSSMVVVGSVAYFVSTSGGADELWRTDGTSAGTVRIKSFPSGAASTLQQLRAFNGKLYFVVGAATASQTIWQSDGTANGTKPVSAVPAGDNVRFQLVKVLNGKLYLTRQVLGAGLTSQVLAETWTIDAAGNASRFVVMGNITSDSFPTPQIGITPTGKVYFGGDDAAHGRELWSVGAPGATPHLIKDIFARTQGSSELESFVRLGKWSYFIANDRIVRTDGTASGTTTLPDLTSGVDPQVLAPFVAGNKLFFTATRFAGEVRLWRTDGTVAGTALVTDAHGAAPPFPTNITPFRGALYFQALDEAAASEALWRTDGTPAGTFPLLERAFTRLAVAGGRLFVMSRADNDARVDLWSSDGTTAGTHKIFSRQIPTPTAFAFNINGAIGAGNTFFFTLGKYLRNGRFEQFDSGELWKSDGTTAGTKLVTALGFETSQYIESGGLVYFTPTGNTQTGDELWRTDGTATGTRLVRDIVPGAGGSFPFNLTDSGGLLYFVAQTPQSGKELWRSDGSAQGTFMLRDINPGSTDSWPQDLAAIDGVLYFNADDGLHGRELWRSDGTVAGTQLALDVRPGAVGSDPTPELSIGNRLLFVATDPSAGSEPWVATLPGDGVLRIDGTDSDDVIRVERADAGTLRITVNGTSSTRAIAGLNEIRVDGTGGDDLISVDAAVTHSDAAQWRRWR